MFIQKVKRSLSLISSILIFFLPLYTHAFDILRWFPLDKVQCWCYTNEQLNTCHTWICVGVFDGEYWELGFGKDCVDTYWGIGLSQNFVWKGYVDDMGMWATGDWRFSLDWTKFLATSEYCSTGEGKCKKIVEVDNNVFPVYLVIPSDLEEHEFPYAISYPQWIRMYNADGSEWKAKYYWTVIYNWDVIWLDWDSKYHRCLKIHFIELADFGFIDETWWLADGLGPVKICSTAYGSDWKKQEEACIILHEIIWDNE